MFDSLTKAVSRLPIYWYAAATVFFTSALVGLTKVTLLTAAPGVTGVVPFYAVASAAGLLTAGLLDRELRGLVLCAVGGAIAGIGLVALVSVPAQRLDILLFAQPLAIVGGAGLGLFAHGILHSATGVVRIGFKVILAGYAASLAFAFVGLPFLDLRRDVHGSPLAILSLAAVSSISIVVAVLVVVVGLRARDGAATDDVEEVDCG
jgi:hypothetical protein